MYVALFLMTECEGLLPFFNGQCLSKWYFWHGWQKGALHCSMAWFDQPHLPHCGLFSDLPGFAVGLDVVCCTGAVLGALDSNFVRLKFLSDAWACQFLLLSVARTIV